MAHSVRIQSGLKVLALLGLALPALAGCETITPAGGRTQQDLAEIKTRVNESLDRQASAERSISSQVSAISDNLDKVSNMMQSSMDELQRRVTAQNDEIEKLRGEVEALNIALKQGGGAQTLGGAAAAGGYAPGSAPAGQPGGLAGGAATPSSSPSSTTGLSLASAAALLNNGQYAQAKESYTQLLSQNPTGDLKVDTLFGLGEACFKLNELDGAKDSYNQAIRANPKNAKAWIALDRVTEIDISQGNKDAAIKKLQYIIQKNPSYRDLDRIKQRLAQLGGGADAGAPQPE